MAVETAAAATLHMAREVFHLILIILWPKKGHASRLGLSRSQVLLGSG